MLTGAPPLLSALPFGPPRGPARAMGALDQCGRERGPVVDPLVGRSAIRPGSRSQGLIESTVDEHIDRGEGAAHPRVGAPE